MNLNRVFENAFDNLSDLIFEQWFLYAPATGDIYAFYPMKIIRFRAMDTRRKWKMLSDMQIIPFPFLTHHLSLLLSLLTCQSSIIYS